MSEDLSDATTPELETNQAEQPSESSAPNGKSAALLSPSNENENKANEHEEIDFEPKNLNIELKDPSACMIIFLFRLFHRIFVHR